MNRKALGFSIPNWIVKLMFLAFSVALLVFLQNHHMVYSKQTQDMRSEIYSKRVVYSPTALAYVDPITNRPYPHVVDLDKFNTDFLESSMDPAGNTLTAAKMELEYEGVIKTATYNKDKYDRWLKGVIKGDNVRTEVDIPVVVYDGEFKNGKLSYDIITVIG